MEDLPTGYYLDNFKYLLDFVDEHYSNLLTKEELNYRRDFLSCSRDAQRLYVRLCGRRGPYFRVDKIFYDEIADLDAAIDTLRDKGFLWSPKDPDALALLSLLTKPDLLIAFPVMNKKLLRGDIEASILAQYSVSEVVNHLSLHIVEPLGHEVITVYRLLFFGNLHQDFSEFVLRDLGLSPFENYTMDSSARYFDDRAILDATLASYELEASCYEVLEEKNLETLIEFTDNCLHLQSVEEPRLQARFEKICNRVAREYERYKKDDLALKLYNRNDQASSLERQARIYAKQNKIDESVSICEAMYSAARTESEKEFSQNFARRLSKKHGLTLTWMPEIVPDDFSVLEIEINNDESLGVELLTSTWFQKQGSQSWYVENSLIPGIFGLYFWDIIFLSIKGVFFNPFQRGPADLFTPEFLHLRSVLIQQRLDSLRVDENFQNSVLSNYDSKMKLANYFVNWNWLDRELVILALERIPRNHFHELFKHLLSDLRHNCSGLPDLVVFPKTEGYLFSEVKGPGDKLQDSQKRWFKFFSTNNIPANIVSVSWRKVQY
ncbi:MAG: VRR-NUC domain-containing protein [Pseudomonadales bacterium]|nr:VRR-NUC domain-containing protein [Pseudomonadales bacterium]